MESWKIEGNFCHDIDEQIFSSSKKLQFTFLLDLSS